MSKTIIFTEKAPKPPPNTYSQGVKAGGLIFIAGQPPIDPVTGEVVGVTIQEQTAQCLRNVQAILEAADSSLDKAVSATFIIADLHEFKGMNEEWVKWFPKDPPARQGATLPIEILRKGMKISIAMVVEA